MVVSARNSPQSGAPVGTVSPRVDTVSNMRFDPAFEALVEFAASRHNAFHTTEAAEIGIPARRLSRARDRGILTPLHPRVWAVDGLGRPQGQRVRAATLAVPGAASCHLGSTWLHGWDDHPPLEPRIWVPGSARPPAGVKLLRAKGIEPRRDLHVVDGITTLNRAATLCLLGRIVNREDLGWYLDQFLHAESRRWLDSTVARLWSPTDRGPTRLRTLLADRDRLAQPTESWLERVVADLLAVADVPALELQYPLCVDGPRLRLDIAMPTIKLGVECHSRSYHFGAGHEDADNVRDLAAGSAGWQLIYVTMSQLADPGGFVNQVAAIARARQRQFGSAAA